MLAAKRRTGEVRPLIRHLRETGQLTAGPDPARAALRQSHDVRGGPGGSVRAAARRASSGLIHAKGTSGFRAVYEKAGLPDSTYPAFREALLAMQEDGFQGELAGATRG